MKRIIVALMLAFPAGVFAQKSDPNMGIIPAPVSVDKGKGVFKFTSETIVMVDSPNHKAMRFFAEYLHKSNLALSVTDMSSLDKKKINTNKTIILSLNFKGELPPEGYELRITENNIELKGRGAGMFYGIQTLIQLMEKGNMGTASIPCGTIKDYPRFAYRGMHLDVSRHFFDVAFVKKYIDVMAMYKLNNFHWHLTDDQGWRIEIKKYPKLTEVGSKRAQTKIGRAAGPTSVADLYDNTPHGGFYTQQEVSEIVDYATARYINVIPEIELPGHSLAALAAYPEWSCDAAKTYKVGETWGVYDDAFCPTEQTFNALYDILREVMELFPSKYIHIGGDECNKVSWKKSQFCRELIAEQKLKNEEGLQSYFIGKIEKFVNSQGRQIIGWDEILEGGLAPNATVMSWRGEKGGIAAAQLGHDVIMTPGSGGLYFDHTQSKSSQEPLSIGGFAPLEKAYNYDPIPSVLNTEQQKRVIGVQANLWTEYIATTGKAEYMLLPRMLSLSETGWTQKDKKDFKNFSEQRIPRHLLLLDQAGYNYRVPAPLGAGDSVLKGNKFRIELLPPVQGAKIYYTIDGHEPTENDMVYTSPVDFTVPERNTIIFKSIAITASGKRSIVNTVKMEN
jgi:hexosaminidase